MWRAYFSNGLVQPPTRKLTAGTQKSRNCWDSGRSSEPNLTYCVSMLISRGVEASRLLFDTWFKSRRNPEEPWVARIFSRPDGNWEAYVRPTSPSYLNFLIDQLGQELDGKISFGRFLLRDENSQMPKRLWGYGTRRYMPTNYLCWELSKSGFQLHIYQYVLSTASMHTCHKYVAKWTKCGHMTLTWYLCKWLFFSCSHLYPYMRWYKPQMEGRSHSFRYRLDWLHSWKDI